MICRSEPLAKGFAAAAEQAGLAGEKQYKIVVSDVYRKPSSSGPAWPSLRPQLSPEQIGQHIGRMLVQQAHGETVTPDHEIIPVSLEDPKA